MGTVLSGMSCGTAFCGLMEIKPKQTFFSPCPNLPPLRFIIPLLSRAPVSSHFCSTFQRESQSAGHPEQNSSTKLSACSVGQPAAVSARYSDKKEQAWFSWECLISPLPLALFHICYPPPFPGGKGLTWLPVLCITLAPGGLH